MPPRQGRTKRETAPFAGARFYAQLLERPGRAVREHGAAETGFPYSERHLRCVWFDPAYRPPSLVTGAGEPVTVLDPGQWNLEPGPDFLDATLEIGPTRRRIRGDVEIHVRPGDWETHGHARNPAYAHVVGHVTYFPGNLPAGQLPTGAVQIALRDPLRADPLFSFESVDLTAYPYAASGKRAPCAEILAAATPEQRNRLLESAGEERLRRKTDRLAAASAERGPDQTLYEEILAALGYKHNRVPFRQLARRVPLEALQAESRGDPVRAQALLTGVAGLLPADAATPRDAESRAFVRALWDAWWKLQTRWEQALMPRAGWRLSSLRPTNHPVRRLAAAAVLFGPSRSLASALRAIPLRSPDTWLRKVSALLAPSNPIPYWNRRFTFGGALQAADVALVGEGRVSAMISNVVIPFLAASSEDVAPLLPLIPPEEDNALVRQTAFLLFGRDHNPALYRTGLRQQGLLQIFHDFCLDRRTGCEGCLLAGNLARLASV